LNTQYLVQYGRASSEWCGSEPSLLAFITGAPDPGGPSESAFDHLADGFWSKPPYFTKPMKLGFRDGVAHSVSVELDELTSGGEYCARLVAFNESGWGAGGKLRFTADAPSVESVTPSSGPTGGASTVTIKGEDLDAASAVHFGTAAASIQSDASEKIVVSTPAHEAASVDVTVTTSAGTSETSAADRYTYEAPSESPGAITPKTTPGAGGGPGPTLGESEEVGVLRGTVTVKTKGSPSFAPFKGGTLPDGSEVDATQGVVSVTVVTPDGKAASSELYGGRFRIHQDRGGETHFALTLPLTGCRKVKLPRGGAAAVTATRRRHRPKSRYLWVSEKGGHWGTNGRYVSTSVEGTSWKTLDECTRTEVLVTAGRVKVRNLVTHRTRRLGPGGRYVAHA